MLIPIQNCNVRGNNHENALKDIYGPKISDPLHSNGKRKNLKVEEAKIQQIVNDNFFSIARKNQAIATA